MASKTKTRAASGDKFAGYPGELPKSDLPTHGDIARYFYLVSSGENDFYSQIRIVQDKLLDVWQACNPRLPLIEKKEIFSKLKKLLTNVKDFNFRKLKLNAKKHLLSIKDKLFDIAACSCSLPIVTCDNPAVQCKIVNCSVEHIICQCPPQLKVPIADREYMRDQRSKVGTKGQFQMRGRDVKGSAHQSARDKRVEENKRRLALRNKRKQHMDQVVANPDIEVSLLS